MHKPIAKHPSKIATFAGMLVFGVSLTTGLAYAECKSYSTGNDDTRYIEYKRTNYTICYGTSQDHLEDRNIARKWVEHALRLGREKYKVRNLERDGHDLKLTVYLPSEPTSLTGQGRVANTCCYNDRYGTLGKNGEIVRHAEVHYLTPSAWEGDALGGLGRPPAHYHAHYFTHEVVNILQRVCCREEARRRGYNVPSWIAEGMAESDGYQRTTDYNRTIGREKLANRFIDRELGNVVWGRDLNLTRTLHVSSVYWAGGFVMNYLADAYGEGIHRELLLDPIDIVLERHHSSVTDLYVDLLVHVDELRAAADDDGRGAFYWHAPNTASLDDGSPATVYTDLLPD